MQIEIDEAAAERFVEKIVDRVLERTRNQFTRLDGAIGMTEVQAATALGLKRHNLRDARLRGLIRATKVGNRYLYSVESLRRFVGEGGGQ
ncbi:MAG: helix-turn-helix domain-containing protein [Planctomycetia bacterium]|nr:helix-turn-helix domain-containing protein [Planctomycetia bacterium]